MAIHPIIKWTGSKRVQSEEIVRNFPDGIDVYYEPFIGGASVLHALLVSGKKVNRFVCSDINSDLISLWNEIKNSPAKLIEDYKERWGKLSEDDSIDRRKAFYSEVRTRFNETRSPSDFLFLSRTSLNGLIRYNNQGMFNASLSLLRDGASPKRLTKNMQYWSKIINDRKVEFYHRDYREVQTNENDMLYADPPYANTNDVYFGKFSLPELWVWLKSQKGRYALSFNGKRGEKDGTYKVPDDIYSTHLYLYGGMGLFSAMRANRIDVHESLYLK